MATKTYIKGLRGFSPSQNAPTFVVGTMIIAPNELFKFLKENENLLTEYKGEKQLKVQITKGDKGLSFALDDFKPQTKKQSIPQSNEDFF